MTEENTAGGLTAEEQAYFDSEGESPLPDTEDVALESEEGGGPSPEAAEKQAAEQAEEEGKSERQRDENGRFVPHGAFHAEREEHKKTKAELQELKEFKIRLEERMRWADEAQAQAKAQEDAPPEINPEEDIFGAFRQKSEKLAALEKKLSEFDSRQAQESEQYEREEQNAQYIQGLGNFARQSVINYAAKDPSIESAQKWLIDFKHKQYNAERFADPRNADPAYRQYRMNVETLQAAEQAYQEGRDFGEVVMEYAKELGWQPEGGGGPSPTAEKLRGIEAAQNGARTVGAAAGKGGGDDISIESIANMPQNEFNAFMATKEGQAAWNRLMGG